MTDVALLDVASRDDLQRFWRLVDTSGGPEACWLWQGEPNRWGYGAFVVGGRMWNASRFALACETGYAPDDQVAAHECDRRRCCNPAHLRWATQLKNMQDKVARGRHKWGVCRGENNGRAKLTADQVLWARYVWQRGLATRAELARTLGVSWPTISKALTGRTWRTTR